MLRVLMRALACVMLVTACSNMDVGVLMERHLWKDRVLLVFAPTVEVAQQQWDRLSTKTEGVKERDIAIWVFVDRTHVLLDGDMQPQLPTNPFYRHYAVERDAFHVKLLGKDGEVKQQWDAPVEAAELFEIIDAMPMRQQEIQGE